MKILDTADISIDLEAQTPNVVVTIDLDADAILGPTYGGLVLAGLSLASGGGAATLPPALVTGLLDAIVSGLKTKLAGLPGAIEAEVKKV